MCDSRGNKTGQTNILYLYSVTKAWWLPSRTLWLEKKISSQKDWILIVVFIYFFKVFIIIHPFPSSKKTKTIMMFFFSVEQTGCWFNSSRKIPWKKGKKRQRNTQKVFNKSQALKKHRQEILFETAKNKNKWNKLQTVILNNISVYRLFDTGVWARRIFSSVQTSSVSFVFSGLLYKSII